MHLADKSAKFTDAYGNANARSPSRLREFFLTRQVRQFSPSISQKSDRILCKMKNSAPRMSQLPKAQAAPGTSSGPEWREVAELYLRRGSARPELIRAIEHLYDWKVFHERKPFYNLSKSLFDKAAALAAIVLLSPLIALTALAVMTTSRGGPFYTQIRIGQFGRPFRILKFRTMVSNTRRTYLFATNEMEGALLKSRNDARITLIGRYLRRWSLDELPQLFNILKGDMSFVGPRPLPAEDSAVIPAEFMIRFAVPPGLTGLWQATARDSLNGLQKVGMDAEYAMSRCWRLDLRLLLSTIPTIFRGTGAW
jgi:lipopolysaccharide/colanic/teichoic acid biosynthesis glycosyltransferase